MSRWLAALALGLLAGCAATPPLPETTTPPAEPLTLPIEAPPAIPAPRPAPRPAPPARQTVAVLFEAATPSAAAIVAGIAATVPGPRYRVTPIALDDSAPDLSAAAPSAIVAVGLKAVNAARRYSATTPIVFTQVFAYEQALAAGGNVWGVHSLPPLELQLEAWKAIDPTLQHVGVILSPAQTGWAADAAEAAEAAATELTLETSSSDRETLYLFKRLAARIDGLWLLPDNRTLGPAALDELLRYAESHGVGVLAFNDELLPRGALLSVSSTPEDVAAKIHDLLDRVLAGDTGNLPAMTPLSAIALQVNPIVAAALGLPPVGAAERVTHE